jgi:hypothetical protein|tara:strand:+ start:439 stop:678 length:240 start_codon:yes stop_codon:yes gene_type:complete
MEIDMERSMQEAWENALDKWMASVPVVELEEITQEEWDYQRQVAKDLGREWDYIEDWKWIRTVERVAAFSQKLKTVDKE